MEQQVGQRFWVVSGLNGTKPQLIQVMAEPFEEEWYVAPGQTVDISGKTPDYLLFKNRGEAISNALDTLARKRSIIEQQIRHLERQR